MPLLQFDLQRAREEGESKELNLPNRTFDIDLSPQELIDKLDNWPKNKPCAMDIEGGGENDITCISFADSPLYAFIVDYTEMGDDVKPDVAKAVNRFMRDPEIPKILHNSLYDNFCLSWQHKMPIANVMWDTMLSSWEIYPELQKGLGTQASIWTREPFYKFERKVNDHRTHLKYCCKDSCLTFEIYEKQKEYLSKPEEADALKHFQFNMDLLPCLMYMSLRGINYDRAKSDEFNAKVLVEQNELLTRIEVEAGRGLNPNSPKQLVEFLYKHLGYEPQYKIVGGRKTTTKTADVEALLKTWKKYNANIIANILVWKQLDKFRQQLAYKEDSDGRIRTAYNVVGTDTGRLACYKSNTGNGGNLQTIMKQARPCLIADEGKYICQVDLSGADGWTVAAHSARLGDERMFEDYTHGVKPAKVIAAMYLLKDESLAFMDSIALKPITEELDLPYWLYHACKAVQHGSCYGMGKNTMSSNILKTSWKFFGNPVHMAPKDCVKLQQLFFKRYVGVLRWQAWIQQELKKYGCLSSPSGHVRHFFGRHNDNSTIQAAYSQEPQATTTFATNTAMYNIYYQDYNRDDNNHFICEPIHQVHDAVITQFDKDKVNIAVPILKRAFNNKITIADRTFVIPYEGEYGDYWGDESGGTITYEAEQAA